MTCYQVLVAAVICVALPAGAQPSGNSANGRDHPLFNRFVDSTIVNYSQTEEANYRLVLGNMRRLAGRVVAEREERLSGSLTRITYEIPQGYGSNDVVAYFQDLAAQRGFTPLFSCSGRDCGNSNYWANDVYNDRSLYGPERGQYYLAWQAETGIGAPSYLSLYVVTRANRRMFAHLEILEADGEAAPSVTGNSLDSLLNTGGLRIDNLTFDAQDRLAEDGGLEPVVRLLQENPSIRVYLVAHVPGPGNLETLMQRSGRRADQVRERLIQQGIDGRRLEARGVGPLAPLCDEGECRERIEVVLQ